MIDNDGNQEKATHNIERDDSRDFSLLELRHYTLLYTDLG